MDKTFGHATYGCMICCGPNNPWMMYDPLPIAISDFENQDVQAINSCSNRLTTVTSDFPSWWTDNSSIATATGRQINGVAVGTTNHNAQSQLMYWGDKEDSGGGDCPLDRPVVSAPTNVTPKVIMQDPPTHVYVGQDSSIVQINAVFSQGSPNGGTYTWSTPDTTTSFDNAHAQDAHVTATNWTGGTNDTRIAVDYAYNGVAAAQATVMVTKRIFERLCCDSVVQVASYNGQIYNGQPTWGYIFQASYYVIANPGNVQVADAGGVSTKEQVTVTSSNVNIVPNTGQGSLTVNSQLVDYPMSILSNASLPSGLNIVESQDWFVGSLYVRNNSLTWTSTGLTVTNNGPTN